MQGPLAEFAKAYMEGFWPSTDVHLSDVTPLVEDKPDDDEFFECDLETEEWLDDTRSSDLGLPGLDLPPPDVTTPTIPEMLLASLQSTQQMQANLVTHADLAQMVSAAVNDRIERALGGLNSSIDALALRAEALQPSQGASCPPVDEQSIPDCSRTLYRNERGHLCYSEEKIRAAVLTVWNLPGQQSSSDQRLVDMAARALRMTDSEKAETLVGLQAAVTAILQWKRNGTRLPEPQGWWEEGIFKPYDGMDDEDDTWNEKQATKGKKAKRAKTENEAGTEQSGVNDLD
jgi:hypothetical protein